MGFGFDSILLNGDTPADEHPEDVPGGTIGEEDGILLLRCGWQLDTARLYTILQKLYKQVLLSSFISSKYFHL